MIKYNLNRLSSFPQLQFEFCFFWKRISIKTVYSDLIGNSVVLDNRALSLMLMVFFCNLNRTEFAPNHKNTDAYFDW